MLVLTRKLSQQLHIGNDIVITVVKVRGNTIRLGIEAPRDVRILRSELDGTPVSADHANAEMLHDSSVKGLAATQFIDETELALEATIELDDLNGADDFTFDLVLHDSTDALDAKTSEQLTQLDMSASSAAASKSRGLPAKHSKVKQPTGKSFNSAGKTSPLKAFVPAKPLRAARSESSQSGDVTPRGPLSKRLNASNSSVHNFN